MKLTERQEAVLSEMRKIARENLYRYQESTPYLFQQDCLKIFAGDRSCVFGLGALTYQIGSRLKLPASAVLKVLRTLESKGLAVRESAFPGYKRPRYWWPVGFAAQLAAELPN